MVWVGIFAGLALLSGPAFLQGLLILGISLAVYRLLMRKLRTPQPEQGDIEPLQRTLPAASIGARSPSC